MSSLIYFGVSLVTVASLRLLDMAWPTKPASPAFYWIMLFAGFCFVLAGQQTLGQS